MANHSTSNIGSHHKMSLPDSAPTIGGPLAPRRFGWLLAAITIGALALRVVYVLTYTRYQNGTTYDSFWYYGTTIGLHSGQFFRLPPLAARWTI